MKLISKDLEIDVEVCTELLIERERLQPTALNYGIGIPHARDTLLNNHFDAVTIVFPEEPIRIWWFGWGNQYIPFSSCSLAMTKDTYTCWQKLLI